MGTIFVGNRLTMEGKHIEVPSEISFLKSPIEEAVYNSFENVFTTVKHRNFLKAMKMNNILSFRVRRPHPQRSRVGMNHLFSRI